MSNIHVCMYVCILRNGFFRRDKSFWGFYGFLLCQMSNGAKVYILCLDYAINLTDDECV